MAYDLRNPLALIHANDQTHRMFIVEQIGLVHTILPNGKKLDTPFMDIRSKVLTSPAFGDERGLLGMAFHPKYRENGRLFVYYITRKRGEKKKSRGWWLGVSVAVLSEWRVSGADLNRVDEHSETILMTVEQPKGNHNGGQLLFAEDTYLYIFLGDGGGAGDPFGKFGNALNMYVSFVSRTHGGQTCSSQLLCPRILPTTQADVMCQLVHVVYINTNSASLTT